MSFQSYAALIGLACVAAVAAAADACAQTPSSPLTRADAIALALADDPGLGAADAASQAAEAGVGAADRRPNPTLELLSENVAGSGPYGSFDDAETTATLSQPLELGGERAARRALAESELAATSLGGELRRLDLIAAVEIVFIDAQAAEATLVLAERQLEAERTLAEAAARRVEQARDPAVVAARAQTRLAASEISVETARQSAAAARAHLASYWGGTGGTGDFQIEVASFDQLSEPGTPDVMASPELALADADVRRAEAALDLERARRVPDLSVEAGLRHFSQTDDTALVVGLSLPLPIWNDNADAVARARADSLRAEREVEATARALARERERLTQQRAIARLEAEGLASRVIPQAEEALAAAQRAYAQGGFSFLEVSEAQSALAEARLARVSALRTYHHAEAGLARLGGARGAPTSSEELLP